MVGHGGSSVGSYLANPASPIPSHCASIVATSTLRVNISLVKKHRENTRGAGAGWWCASTHSVDKTEPQLQSQSQSPRDRKKSGYRKYHIWWHKRLVKKERWSICTIQSITNLYIIWDLDESETLDSIVSLIIVWVLYLQTITIT